MRISVLVFLFAFASSGCLLQRSALSTDVILADADMTDASVPIDGDSSDAFRRDAFMPDTDSGPVLPDAGIDAGDSGMVDPDSGVDSGMVDPDSGIDSGMDAGRLDGGGFNPCSDETGICLRFENVSGSMSVTGWMINVIWTRTPATGGGVIDEGWVSETCLGGIRREDAFTTECRFSMPVRPADATADLAVVFAYPVYAGFVSACSASACPNYPAGYSVWKDSVVQTHMVESRMGTPSGTLIVLRLAL